MKKRLLTILLMVFVLMITGCGNSNSVEELADMTTSSEDGYTAIVWGENTYVPYCAIQRNECGKQIGFVDGDKDNRVYEYDGYSTDEWIISIYVSGLMDGAMLYREINVTDIPDGLQSEYEWNNVSTESVSEEFETDTEDKQTSENVTKEEGIYVYNEEAQISEIALSFSLKNISPTGATLVFDQYDTDSPKGELMFGEDFVIEVLKNGEWEEAPIPVEWNYAFNAIAFMLPCEEITEREIEWKWIYGELEPGEYRIGKDINDFIESGNFDKYMVYAHFILN